MTTKQITGSVVRVLNEEGKPTTFVGTAVRMRETPSGRIVEVAGNQRRLEVPVKQVVLETECKPFAPYNVHRDKGAMRIDGDHVALDIAEDVLAPGGQIEQEKAALRLLEGGR